MPIALVVVVVVVVVVLVVRFLEAINMAAQDNSTFVVKQNVSPVARQLLIRTAVGIVLLFVLHIIYNGTFHPLSKIPGQVLARYSTFWLTRHYFRGTWLQDVVRLHETYGPVVRIAPNEVSFVDEGALRELYGHGKASVKTRWYDTWIIPGMGDSFFATTNRDVHRRIRSRVSGTYSMSAVLAMEQLLGEVMDLNLSKLRELAVKGRPIRIDEWVNYFTFDVVGQLSMGGGGDRLPGTRKRSWRQHPVYP